MGFGKSFGIGLLIFLVLNFIMNLLLVVAGGAYLGASTVDISSFFGTITGGTPLWFFSNLFVFNGGVDLTGVLASDPTIGGLLPASLSILLGAMGGIGAFTAGTPNYFLGIMLILGPIIPGLIASIVAGKMADTPPQGFGSMVLISLLSSIGLLVFWIIDPAQMANHLALVSWLDSFGTYSEIMLYVAIPVIGLFQGMFWSGISAVLGREF